MSPRSPTSTPANYDPPEAAHCTACATCPAECRAVDRTRAEAKAYLNPRRIGVQARIEYSAEASDGKCACPSCECYQGRIDSWSLGILVGQLFEVFASTEGVPRLSECRVCGQVRHLHGNNLFEHHSENPAQFRRH